VAARWQRTASGLALNICVPANATGRVYIPAADAKAITEAGGGQVVPADRAGSIKLIGIEGNRVVYEVGSGSYEFRVAQ
jgi:alpha-L-rhamnosidase